MGRHADLTPLTPAQSILVAENFLNAQKISTNLSKSHPRLQDEIQSAVNLALVSAAKHFDPSRGTPFIPFAYNRLRGASIDVLRGRTARGYRSYPGKAPSFVPLEEDSADHGQFFMCEPDKPIGWELELSELIDKWLAKLPIMHATACRSIYLEGLSKEEAADRLQCSHHWLLTLLHEAIIKLKRIARPDMRI